MFDFPEALRIHAGDYVADFVNWLKTTLGFVFDAIGNFVLHLLLYIQDFLLWLPWWSFIIIVFLIGWWLRTFGLGLLFAAMLFLIGTFNLWDHMMLTLAIVLTSVIIAVIIGIPVGILMATWKTIEMIMKPILDFMQTMPSFVYLIPAILLFSLGVVPAIFATLIYCAPPVIRLTSLAINGVSKEMVEAAQSFGSSRWQLLMKVQLPQAMPTIMTGVNQTTMMALAMVVIASMVGAEGLGMDVLQAINHIRIGDGFEAGISIVFLAIIIDRLTIGIANRFTTQK
ncbi:MAG TPA: proline/glycine betaine ABC transporter permease [Bacillales bacterium]|nr:proline/glycine betaine ABC transporter permease [Bacillales bacterium]